jgi:pimeloyl-ACP methyl ester carboxylesterase
VTIGAPATSRFLVDKFVAMNEVERDHAERLVTELEDRYGQDLWQVYSASEIVKDIAIPGLVIHGKNDDFVPPEHAEQIGANWRSARLELVDGVGHFDSALSREVRNLVVNYLKQRLQVN